MENETEWAYIAGLVDGEGTLNIIRNTSTPSRKGFVRQFIFVIYNTNLEFLEKIQSFTNSYCKSRIQLFHRNTSRTLKGGYNEKDFYGLQYYHNALRKILPKIIPHLIMKKKLAELMLQELQLMNTANTSERESKLIKLDKEFRAVQQICGCKNRNCKIDKLLKGEK